MSVGKFHKWLSDDIIQITICPAYVKADVCFQDVKIIVSVLLALLERWKLPVFRI